MTRISIPAAPAFLRRLGWPALVRLGAAALAALFLVAGAAVLATGWPPGAMTAEQAAAAPDSTFSTAGTIDRIWAEGAASVTHLRLAGAPDLDFRIAGNALAGYAAGEFVVIDGAKVGDQVEAHSVREAADPIEVAAPWVALGAVMAALVATDFLVRWSTGAGRGRFRLRMAWPPRKRSAEAGAQAKAVDTAAPSPERR